MLPILSQMLNRRNFLVYVALFFLSAHLFCDPALSIRDEALGKNSVQDSIDHILSRISTADSPSGKRGLWCLAGNLQELSGDWVGAAKSYLQALRISGQNASGFDSMSVDQLRISAAKCFLNYCDFDNAELNLKSFTNSSKDEKLAALASVYSVWVSLCKSKSISEISGPIEKLKSYLEMDSMKTVRGMVLFTLWYISGEKKYLDQLKKDYPVSAEYSIAIGRTTLSAVPFWYFVPRCIDGEDAISPDKAGTVGESKSASEKVSTEKKDAPGEKKVKLEREQLGLFKSQTNADALIESAKEKGFEAYSFTETRASGTTYYIVVVDENEDGTMGKKLRAAGFDCYPVE